MRLAQDDDMVQALAPDRSDNPFGKAILPGRGWCNWLISDAHGAKSAWDNGSVDPIAVPDHIARSPIPGKKHLLSASISPFEPFSDITGCPTWVRSSLQSGYWREQQ